jgi:hypothetical protein
MPKTKRREDASMSVEQEEMPPAPAQPTSAASPPTGYRISIFPAAVEISARLATTEELQTLVKILQANAAIWDVAKNADEMALVKSS